MALIQKDRANPKKKQASKTSKPTKIITPAGIVVAPKAKRRPSTFS